MKEFLRRRLNPFLLISTVAVLAILAGLSVAYQDVLSEKVSTNQELQGELEEKNTRIAALENETANLTSALERARNDLAATVNETQRQEEVITDLEDTVDDLNATVLSLEETVASQEANISDLEDEIDTLESDLTTICEDTPDANMTDDAAEICEDWD